MVEFHFADSGVKRGFERTYADMHRLTTPICRYTDYATTPLVPNHENVVGADLLPYADLCR